MKKAFLKKLESCPVIAAAKNAEGLEDALASECDILFVLYGDVCSIAGITSRIKERGKIAIVHIDLVNGLSGKEISVDYLHAHTDADGIISTRPALIKRARELGMVTVLRLFILDSLSFDNLPGQCRQARPDCIDILPGVMPKIIRRICRTERTPLIASGLFADKEDIIEALNAGAVSVSTTRRSLWTV